jgi:predicted acylesterase/phospholipase RssA
MKIINSFIQLIAQTKNFPEKMNFPSLRSGESLNLMKTPLSMNDMTDVLNFPTLITANWFSSVFRDTLVEENKISPTCVFDSKHKKSDWFSSKMRVSIQVENDNLPSHSKMNLSERSVDKLRASPERSEGEDQFSVACEGKFKYMVISGGAAAGFSFIGVLQRLYNEKKWDYSSVKTIYATSVGAICALIVALKVDNYNDVVNYFIESPWEEVFHLNGNFIESFCNRGIFSKDVIENMFAPIFKYKNYSSDITLLELYNNSGIDIHCFTTELNSFTLVDMSHKTHPNYKVLDVIYSSICYPVLFQPYYLENVIYADGGCLCNYPLYQFIEKERPENYDEILGINIDESVDVYDKDCNLLEYLTYLFKMYFFKTRSISEKNVTIKHEIIIKDAPNAHELIAIVQDIDKIKELIEIGRKSVEQIYPEFEDSPECNVDEFKGVTETGTKSPLNFSTLHSENLRASPERSEGKLEHATSHQNDLSSDDDDPNPLEFKHIIISGGGAVGFSFLGVLQRLYNEKLWKYSTLKTIYATSVGVIGAFIMALQVDDFNDVVEYFANRPWEKLFHLNGNILEYFFNRGILGKEVVEGMFAPILKYKDYSPDITLLELYNISGIEIHSFSTELTSFKLVDMSYKTHPDYKIIDVIYSSICLPILFKPHCIGDNVYIDGGCLCNYPLRKFIENECPENYDEVLGVSIYETPTKLNENSNIFEYLSYVLNSFVYKVRGLSEQKIDLKHEIHICEYPSMNDIINIMNNPEKRKELISCGNDIVTKFILQRSKAKETEQIPPPSTE